MKRSLAAWAMLLLIGALAHSAEVRRLISAGDISFGSGTFSDTGGLTLNKVNADSVPFSQDNDVKIGLLYYFALAADNGVSTYCLKSAGDNTFYWGECVAGGLGNIVITGGTIDNTIIGGTTPAAGTFSSITRGTVSDTEFSYLDNVSSNIQLQLDNKQPLSSFLTDISDGSLTAPLVLRDDVYLKLGTDNDFRVYYNAATDTLIVALDNGSSVCAFSKTLGLVCSGEVTASQFNSTATDGQRYIDVSNTTDPTPAEGSYPCQYNVSTTPKRLKCWNGSAWDNLAIVGE